jgi:hypothetical protein
MKFDKTEDKPRGYPSKLLKTRQDNARRMNACIADKREVFINSKSNRMCERNWQQLLPSMMK